MKKFLFREMMKNEKWSYLENLQVVRVQPYHKQTLAYFQF